jgi:hypothetical protein
VRDGLPRLALGFPVLARAVVQGLRDGVELVGGVGAGGLVEVAEDDPLHHQVGIAPQWRGAVEVAGKVQAPVSAHERRVLGGPERHECALLQRLQPGVGAGGEGEVEVVEQDVPGRGDLGGGVVAEEHRKVAFGSPPGQRRVCGDHALLNDHIGDVPFEGSQPHHGAVLVGGPAGQQVVQSQGPVLPPAREENFAHRGGLAQTVMQGVVGVADRGGDLGVVHGQGAAHRGPLDLDVIHGSVPADLHVHRQRRACAPGGQRQAVLHGPWKHLGPAAPAAVGRLAPPQGLAVGVTAQGDSRGDVGDVDRQPPSVARRMDRDGVVAIDGPLAVDHDRVGKGTDG